MTQSAPFAGTTFGAPQARSSWFADAVLRQVEADRPLRVLDIGCGNGAHLFALAARMPKAMFHGVDISAANIEQAERTRKESAAAGRIEFWCANYLQFQGEAFDLVVSDSALHLIEGETATVLSRIAANLVPGGLLIASIPDGGLYNRVLWLARRAFVALRSPRLDAWALALASRLHRGAHDAAFLQERIPYLYILPLRHEGKRLREAARDHGLQWLGSQPVPHASIAQPVHVLATYQRTRVGS